MAEGFSRLTCSDPILLSRAAPSSLAGSPRPRSASLVASTLAGICKQQQQPGSQYPGPGASRRSNGTNDSGRRLQIAVLSLSPLQLYLALHPHDPAMSLARVAAPSRSTLARASLAQAASRRSFTTQKAGAIPVAAADDGAPTSSVTVAVRAGPRYESTPGVANALKNFLFKSTSKRSALRLVRESELYGGLLSASLSKEHLFVTAEFLRGDE